MTTPLNTLRDALQTYIHAVEDNTGLILTDFVIGYAAIDLHTADDRTFNGTVASGAGHATFGLAHLLTQALPEGVDS